MVRPDHAAAATSGLDDIRFTHYHVIDRNWKWTTDWSRFPGVPLALPAESKWISRAHDDHQWMQDCWHYSMYVSLGYLLVIWSLSKWMTNRPAYDLRRWLAVWSASLAVFSIAGTIRCLPEFIHILRHRGFTASFCVSSYYEDIRLPYWYLTFVLSKAVELGDTVFIVLRKQKLKKLHWIHHVLTLCYSWFVFGDVPATARWMVTMNFTIHSVMYSYYALKALRCPVPRIVAIAITISQITQMLFGFFINLKSLQFKLAGVPCDLSVSVATSGFLLYSLFFVLFLNFFVKTYRIYLKSVIAALASPDSAVCLKILGASSYVNNNNNNNTANKKKS